MEGMDHVRFLKKTRQRCKDLMFGKMYELNNWNIYGEGFMRYIKGILHYSILENIVRRYDPSFADMYPLKGAANKFWKAIMYLPAKILTPVYIKRKTAI